MRTVIGGRHVASVRQTGRGCYSTAGGPVLTALTTGTETSVSSTLSRPAWVPNQPGCTKFAGLAGHVRRILKNVQQRVVLLKKALKCPVWSSRTSLLSCDFC